MMLRIYPWNSPSKTHPLFHFISFITISHQEPCIMFSLNLQNVSRQRTSLSTKKDFLTRNTGAAMRNISNTKND